MRRNGNENAAKVRFQDVLAKKFYNSGVWVRLLALAVLAMAFITSCGESPEAPAESTSHTEEHPTICAPDRDAPSMLPGIAAEELSLEYWLEYHRTRGDLDTELLNPSAIDAQNAALAFGADDDLPFARDALATTPSHELMLREVQERLGYLRERLESGNYVDAEGQRFDAEFITRFASPSAIALAPELRVTTAPLALRCGPTSEPFYSSPPNLAFDRNACSTIERQEPIQVLARMGEMLLVRSRYAFGWIAANAALSPPVPEDEIAVWTHAPRARSRAPMTLRAEDGAAIDIDPNLLLPIDSTSPDRLHFASNQGFHRSTALSPDQSEPVRRPLTWRSFLTEAFRHLGQPYGWGGHDGGLDCSEFVMDTLATFGIEMPRHSSRQATAGTFVIDVPSETNDADRLRLLDAAARRGIVLLHFPGHIMMWLGRTPNGEPRVLHSFAEYLEPCAEGGESLLRVNRVTVSNLELGRGTSRRAFIERLDKIIVIGASPGPELAGVATLRRALPVMFPETASACTDSVRTRIFQMPAMPHVGAPLRYVITSGEDIGAIDIAVRDPSGRITRPTDIHRLGGPPFTFWGEIRRPTAGPWTIAVGDGEHLVACDRVHVAQNPRSASDALPLPVGSERRLIQPTDAIWVPRWRWEEDTENLYAAFVEQLFAYPPDDRTWRSLSELLRDREHNLLFDHLGQNEEARLELVPDCADLPYFLRAYFAWKLRLPFAFRRCTRGRPGTPPACGDIVTSAMPHEYTDEVEAFRFFIERHVRPGVHSASGRTAPNDDATDLYPIPLTREALRPGTVFSDPYGHLLILSAWQPQGASGPGVLFGADAQPDGTIGRRTFWRGTFLFTPDTTDVGAGFKAFRPVLYDRREDSWTTRTNEELRNARDTTPFSSEQYRGTQDDFYERMESLIHPRALDPDAMQLSLIDALAESVARRVVSIDNVEEWFRTRPNAVIEMPEGTDIFLTEGAWEDFSTPSRDMRLLVAIDTVLGLPESLRRNPAHFGLSAGPMLEQAVASATERLREELERRRFSYTRSDGSRQELTLAELVTRRAALEIGWNPNDCVELRWGAENGSEEAATCRRRSPDGQRRKMDQMRAWFTNRQRPTR